MTIDEENRSIIVNYRLQRSKETLLETKKNVEMGFWHTGANRLYYACYYAVTALLREEDVIHLLEPAERFIAEIEN
jgi:uncharacterized protein (UPF0332 family)